MADLTITGIHDSYTTNGTSIAPFGGVTVSDSADGTIDTLKFFGVNYGQISGVAYSGATLSDSNGGYRIIGTASQVTASLSAVVYTPQPPQAGRTTVDQIGFSVSNSANGFAEATSNIYDTTAPDIVSLSPQVSYRNGIFTLTGTVSTALGVTGVAIQAIVDGVPTHLGATRINADGSFTFQDQVGPHTQSFITATTLNASSINGYSSARNVASFSLTGGLRQGAYGAEQDSYTADGSTQTSTMLFRADGGRRVDVLAAGQTFSSDHSDVWNNGGMPETTFVFDPGYGHDAVGLFRVGGADHDTLSFKGSDFGTDPASQLAGVLANTHSEKGGVVITDPATQDTVKLFGVSKQQFVANRQDVTFHA